MTSIPLIALLLTGTPDAAAPEIRTEDVDRFYQVYEKTNGKPDTETLQRDYIDHATPGFVAFMAMRKTTAARISEAVAAQPAIFADARKCVTPLPKVRERTRAALRKLSSLYPQATLAPVTLAIGRGKPIGVANSKGVMIGLEALCAADFMEPNVEDRFVHIIAHEYIHVQQGVAIGDAASDDGNATVLTNSLIEGVAEFLGELTSGSVASRHLPTAMRGREKAIETEFTADLDKPAVGSAWLYNHPGTKERPADIGYWIGYRIAKAYYRNASDKAAAIREMIAIRDPHAFLEKSGWTPGIALD